MNGKDILLALNDIPEEMIEEAESKAVRKRFPVKHLLPLAACLCVIIGIAGAFLPELAGETAAMDSAAPENGMALESISDVSRQEMATAAENGYGRVTDFLYDDPADALTDFGIRLLQNIPKNGQNTLISPLSVIYALGMTANGAEGQTLTQMETALGISVEELNPWLSAYTGQLAQEEGNRLLPANGIWYRNSGFTAENSFLEVNRTYYQAEIHGSAFDQDTLAQINNWVNDKTLGMIPSILDQIRQEDMLYLINALAFEAEWEIPYTQQQVSRDIFHTADCKETEVEYLSGKERAYVEGANFTGFIKYYTDRRYAFVALLPNEDVTVESLIASLDAQELRQLLLSPEQVTVHTSIPKFRTETSLELSATLKAMGMELAFDSGKADFTSMGITATNDNLHISKILHKTFLQLDELGTRAGAVTAMIMGSNRLETDSKTVTLDRPFVYMLVDCEQQLPFFIGYLMNPEA